MQFSNNSSIFRFTLVGLLNTLVDFGLFNLLVVLLADPSGATLLACNAAAFLAANLCSYFCNRSWTFGRSTPASVREYGAYLAISLVGLLLNTLVLWLLTGGAVESFWQLNLAKAAATVVSMVWNFCGYRVLLSR